MWGISLSLCLCPYISECLFLYVRLFVSAVSICVSACLWLSEFVCLFVFMSLPCNSHCLLCLLSLSVSAVWVWLSPFVFLSISNSITVCQCRSVCLSVLLFLVAFRLIENTRNKSKNSQQNNVYIVHYYNFRELVYHSREMIIKAVIICYWSQHKFNTSERHCT